MTDFEIKPKPKRKLRSSSFKPGNKMSKGGTRRGTKNKSTLLKEAVLAEAEDLILKNVNKIVRKTIQLADEGDTTCLKILWDRIIPIKKSDESDSREDKLNITISIEGMETKTATISEGDFKEVKECTT